MKKYGAHMCWDPFFVTPGRFHWQGPSADPFGSHNFDPAINKDVGESAEALGFNVPAISGVAKVDLSAKVRALMKLAPDHSPVHAVADSLRYAIFRTGDMRWAEVDGASDKRSVLPQFPAQVGRYTSQRPVALFYSRDRLIACHIAASTATWNPSPVSNHWFLWSRSRNKWLVGGEGLVVAASGNGTYWIVQHSNGELERVVRDDAHWPR